MSGMRLQLQVGNLASVCLFAEQERNGSAAEHVSKRRKKVKCSEVKRQTEAGARAITPRVQLVTSARFAQWNGRGRGGEGAD